VSELNFGLPRTPADIFQAIDNQSVNKIDGERIIELYGDQRVREAMASLNLKFGIEQEVCDTITRIEKLIDVFYEKVIRIGTPKRKRK